MDTGEKISREFVIACRDNAKVLEFVAGSLDEITLQYSAKSQSVSVVCHVSNERLWIGGL